MRIYNSLTFMVAITFTTSSQGIVYTLGPAAQLIYEFASNFRHINRISLLSCQDLACSSTVHQPCSKTTSSDTPASATIDNFTLLETLFGAKGVLIKVLAIDTLFAWWSSKSNGTLHREPFLPSDDHRQVVVLMLACGNNSLKILQLASDQELFNSSYHWLLIDEDGSDTNAESETNRDRKDYSANRTLLKAEDTPSVDEYVIRTTNKNKKNSFPRLQLIELLSKLDINVNTELILARKTSSRMHDGRDEPAYVLFDVWSPGRRYDRELNITEVGLFTQRNGLQINNWFRKTTSTIRRMDMKNVLLRCMMVVTNFLKEDLDNYVNHQHHPHLDSMHRYNFVLLQIIKDIFNFRLRLYRTRSWGYKFKNGSMDGMIGALVRRQVDIGGSPIFFRKERAEVIDYTARTWVARPCFIFRHPNTTNLTRTAFLRPFSNRVWKCFMACGLFITVTLWNSIQTEGRILHKKDRVVCLEHRGSSNKMYPRHSPQVYQHTLFQDSSNLLEVNPIVHYQANNHSQNSSSSIINFCHKSVERFLGRFFRNFHSPTSYQVQANAISIGSTKPQFRCHRRKLKNIHWPTGECAAKNNPHKLISEDESFHGKKAKDDLLFQDTKRNSLQSSIFFFIGAVCQQGTHYSCQLLSGRIVILSTLLFTFCISQFYSGTIVGTLLMEKPKTMKTIRDLIDSSLEIGIESVGYNHDYFRRTTDPDAIELYRKKISQPVDEQEGYETATLGWHSISSTDDSTSSSSVKAETNKKHESTTLPGDVRGDASQAGRKMKKGVAVKEGWLTADEGLKLMKTGGYAFHVEVASAYKIIAETFTEQEICELTEIQLFPPQKMVGIVQKGSPLRKMITYGLRRLAETGLMDRQRKVWHSQKPRCIRQIQPTNLRVGMETFSSALFVLIFGLAASGVILALEVMYDLWHKRSPASKSPNIGQKRGGTTPATSQRERHRTRPAEALKDNAAGNNFEFVN